MAQNSGHFGAHRKCMGPKLKLCKVGAIVFLVNMVFSVYNEYTICQIMKDVGSWHHQNVRPDLFTSL